MKRNAYRTLEALKASSLWTGLAQPPLPKNTRVYKSTRLEDMIYNDLRNLDGSLDALETQGSEKLDTFPSLVRDMFQVFYSLNPLRNDSDDLTANARKFNAEILDFVTTNADYPAFKALCEGRELPAYEAVGKFAERILNKLDSLLEAAGGEKNSLSVLNKLEKQYEALKERVQTSEPADLLNLASKADSKVRQVERLSEIVSQNMRKNKKEIESIVVSALSAAKEKAKETAAVLKSWGNNEPSPEALQQNGELLRRVKSSQRLREQSKITVAGHLEEKRGIYQIVLSWKKPDGKRERRGCSTGLQVKGNKKRAEDMLREKCREYEQILAERPSNHPEDILFADFLGLWLEAVKPEVKRTTFTGYRNNVERVMDPYFRPKGVLLKDLSAEDVNAFYAERLKQVKAMTVHKCHANIHHALKYAVEKGLLEHSVMDKVKRPKVERFVGKFLRQSEAVELFNAVKGHKLELGVMLGAFYGLRRSEVVGLKWSAIDFEANTITIGHTVTIAKDENWNRVLIADDTTKSKSSFRTLPLVPQFRARLLELREEQEQNKKLCGRAYDKVEGEYVYVNPLGKRINPEYLTVQFPKFMVEHGFRRMRYHDLRHSYVKPTLKNFLRNFQRGLDFFQSLSLGAMDRHISVKLSIR